MTQNQAHAHAVADALARCGPLGEESPERDQLWHVLQDTICTRERRLVVPLGSSTPIQVTPDLASQELLAAMDWLTAREQHARRLSPMDLYIMLVGVATRGASGSGRAAQSDALRGMTNVSPGNPIVFVDESRAAEVIAP